MESFILDFKEIRDKTGIFSARFDLSDFDVSIKTWFVKKTQNQILTMYTHKVGAREIRNVCSREEW